MKSTTTELDQSAPEGACDAKNGSYSHRVSQTIERGILAFVVLVSLLGTYANHSYLMSGVLVS